MDPVRWAWRASSRGSWGHSSPPGVWPRGTVCDWLESRAGSVLVQACGRPTRASRPHEMVGLTWLMARVPRKPSVWSVARDGLRAFEHVARRENARRVPCGPSRLLWTVTQTRSKRSEGDGALRLARRTWGMRDACGWTSTPVVLRDGMNLCVPYRSSPRDPTQLVRSSRDRARSIITPPRRRAKKNPADRIPSLRGTGPPALPAQGSEGMTEFRVETIACRDEQIAITEQQS